MDLIANLQSNTAALDTLPQPIAIFDRHGREQVCNQAWAKLAAQMPDGFSLIEEGWPDSEPTETGVNRDATRLSLRSAIVRCLTAQVAKGAPCRPLTIDDLPSHALHLQPIGDRDNITGCVAVVVDSPPPTQGNQALELRIDELRIETQHLREVSDSFREIMELINANHPLQDILDFIVRRACALLDADAAMILQLDAAGQMRIQASTQARPNQVAGLALPMGLVKVAEAIQKREPVAVCDVQAALSESLPSLPDPQLRGIMVEVASQYQAILFVPLIADGEVYGEIALAYSRPRTFSKDEMDIATSFCGPATLAIQNARLLTKVQGKAILEERQRLARELHDSVTQSLYSVTLHAEAGRRLARAGDHDRVERCFEQLAELSQQCLKEMRLLVYELRPVALESVGLVGALQQRLDAVEKRAGLKANLHVEGETDLPDFVVEDLFRIAQEALNNALKHARATEVTARVGMYDDRVEIEITDNGIGFEVESLADTGGMGMGTMRQRAERVGGTLTIQSAPGQGTRVRANLPLSTPRQPPV